MSVVSAGMHDVAHHTDAAAVFSGRLMIAIHASAPVEFECYSGFLAVSAFLADFDVAAGHNDDAAAFSARLMIVIHVPFRA